jgi:hypothetical protein
VARFPNDDVLDPRAQPGFGDTALGYGTAQSRGRDLDHSPAERVTTQSSPSLLLQADQLIE